jgi:hypothetical protein
MTAAAPARSLPVMLANSLEAAAVAERRVPLATEGGHRMITFTYPSGGWL